MPYAVLLGGAGHLLFTDCSSLLTGLLVLAERPCWQCHVGSSLSAAGTFVSLSPSTRLPPNTCEQKMGNHGADKVVSASMQEIPAKDVG